MATPQNTLTRDQAQLVLNDHLGETVEVEVLLEGRGPVLGVSGELRSAPAEIIRDRGTDPVFAAALETEYWLVSSDRVPGSMGSDRILSLNPLADAVIEGYGDGLVVRFTGVLLIIQWGLGQG
jgi:hypothetical protein